MPVACDLQLLGPQLNVPASQGDRGDTMPIYEYRCSECDSGFEVLVRGNNAVSCPHCGSSAVEKLLSAPVMLSGQTTRKPGHTCCGRDERCEVPPCSEGSECRR